MSEPNDDQDWVQYQQTEIDEAKEEIESRRNHLGDYRGDGLLDGEMLQERENKRLEAYLQGYADALDYASNRVERIDNLVKYALEVDPNDE